MVNPKQKLRQEKRLPNMAIEPPPDMPQYKGEKYRKERKFPTPIDDEYEGQVVQWEDRAEGSNMLVGFAVMLQLRPLDSDEGWADVVRVDIAHGFVHVDSQDARGVRDKDENRIPAEWFRTSVRRITSSATESPEKVTALSSLRSNQTRFTS